MVTIDTFLLRPLISVFVYQRIITECHLLTSIAPLQKGQNHHRMQGKTLFCFTYNHTLTECLFVSNLALGETRVRKFLPTTPLSLASPHNSVLWKLLDQKSNFTLIKFKFSQMMQSNLIRKPLIMLKTNSQKMEIFNTLFLNQWIFKSYLRFVSPQLQYTNPHQRSIRGVVLWFGHSANISSRSTCNGS